MALASKHLAVFQPHHARATTPRGTCTAAGGLDAETLRGFQLAGELFSLTSSLQKLSGEEEGLSVFSCLLIRNGNEAESARASLRVQSGQLTRVTVSLELFSSAINPRLTLGE